MILNYYSNWVLFLFILWSLGYVLKIDIITRYINPYKSTVIASIGFICLIICNTVIKGYKYELSFLIGLTMMHFIPLYVTYKHSTKTYDMENLLISLIGYGIYMVIVNKDPITVYLLDRQPSTWNMLCKSFK